MGLAGRDREHINIWTISLALTGLKLESILGPFLSLWQSCIKTPVVKGHTVTVVFKELIRKLQRTSGAFKISRIKYLRLSCSPLW